MARTPQSPLRGAAAPLALALAACLCGSAGAQEMTSARKVGRGLAGLTTFPLELPGNIVQEGRTNGALSAATAGVAVGLVKMVARPLVGVYELVTAPFELPEGFEPVLEPEFPWSYFDSAPGRVYGFTPIYLDAEKAAVEAIPGAVAVRRRGALAVQFPDDLLFASGSAQLSPRARGRLNDLALVLREHPDTVVEVQGFTDGSGRPDDNLALSERRAEAVRSYLVSRGIDASRVEPAGFGEIGPVASNETPAGRQANRRVEIEIRASGVAAYR
jgi:putative exosortase-associated protein (TIGR04073 family)